MSVEREILGYKGTVHAFTSSNSEVIIPATYGQISPYEVQLVQMNNGMPITSETIDGMAGAHVTTFYANIKPKVISRRRMQRKH